MPEHLASMKQPNTNATHWRRGTSAITQFHIAPHWRRYLIPTGKQGTPLFFYDEDEPEADTGETPEDEETEEETL